MSMLDSIKGERKLSFGHWRYRLLHWCFNIEHADPKRPQDTGLPKFLYTHYCPLFHLTNLIAILAPLVLFIKICVVCVKAVVLATGSVDWSKLSVLWSWIPRNEATEPKPSAKRTAEEERYNTVMFCRQFSSNVENSFERFWSIYELRYETLLRDEVEAVFNEFMPQITEAQNRAKLRKDKLRERLIFWSNFSRVFIKCVLNVFYFALTFLVLYLIYLAASPVWDGICWLADGIYWLFTDEGSLSFVILFFKVLMWFSIGCGSLYVLAKVGWLQRFGCACGHGFAKLSPPFYLVGRFGKWIVAGTASVFEFISMFYEENCPPIKIVTEEEAIVEEI